MQGEWVRGGSVSVVNGSDVVTGIGTAWHYSGVIIGDFFIGPDKEMYEVTGMYKPGIEGPGDIAAERITVRSIDGVEAYEGVTNSSGSYSIIRNWSNTTNATLAARIAELLGTYSSAATTQQVLRLNSTSQFFHMGTDGLPDPPGQTIVFTVTTQNLGSGDFIFSTMPHVKSQSGSNATFSLTAEDLGGNKNVKVIVNKDGLTDAITVHAITVGDGEPGQGVVKSFCFIRSATTPITPTGGSYEFPLATGYSDGIPPGTDLLWQTTRIFTSDELPPHQDSWTTPFKINDRGQGTKVEFSSDNIHWHDDPNTDDIYMRSSISTDGGVTWTPSSGSVKIKGETGNDGIPGIRGADGIDASNWGSTLTFSSSAYNRISWSGGATLYSGVNGYIIAEGSITGMSASPGVIYYIFFDPTASTNALRSTTTASDSVGSGKVLVAVAKANSNSSSTTCQFQVFGGAGGLMITADNIAANSITANHVALNSLDASVIKTSSLLIGDLSGAGDLASMNRSDLNYADGADKTSANIDSAILQAKIDGQTLIENGFIRTNFIDTDNMVVNKALYIGNYGEENITLISARAYNANTHANSIHAPSDADKTSSVLSTNSLAWKTAVSAAMLDTTVISGGYIKTSLIKTDAIVIGDLSGASTFTAYNTNRVNGTAASTVVSNASAGAAHAGTAHAPSNADRTASNISSAILLAKVNGVTLIEGGYIRTSLINTDNMIVNKALYIGNYNAASITAINTKATNAANTANLSQISDDGGNLTITTGKLTISAPTGMVVNTDGGLYVGSSSKRGSIYVADYLGTYTSIQGSDTKWPYEPLNMHGFHLIAPPTRKSQFNITGFNYIAYNGGIVGVGGYMMSNSRLTVSAVGNVDSYGVALHVTGDTQMEGQLVVTGTIGSQSSIGTSGAMYCSSGGSAISVKQTVISQLQPSVHGPGDIWLKY